MFNQFSIDDLLDRYEVKPNLNLLNSVVKNKSILVTGAGGSIGLELSFQLSKLNAKRLILLESNEHSLYNICQTFEEINTNNIEIIPVLGSASNFNLIKKLLVKNNIDIIFHAAAYKHVPLVEENPTSGIFNNVICTKTICSAALDTGVKEVVLISTDKAVRPTNIMGASKRLSEMIMQAYNWEQSVNKKTKYCIVRFGNVLGSSGSVLPLFKKQIEKGGPITLTHPEVNRYFMTIKEAVQLVIQSSALSEGGEVFLLDMGKPVKIKHLAEKLVLKSGLKVKNNNQPNGDIEVVTTGLRTGEKLYEELLIDSTAEKTDHSLIYKAKEDFIKPPILWEKLKLLEENLLEENSENSIRYLSELVPEWKNKKNINI